MCIFFTLHKGLDWHGPSACDIWSALSALTTILVQHASWQPWKLAPNTQAIVMGHSNGGQGAWYVGERWPDRVAAGEWGRGAQSGDARLTLVYVYHDSGCRGGVY